MTPNEMMLNFDPNKPDKFMTRFNINKGTLPALLTNIRLLPVETALVAYLLFTAVPVLIFGTGNPVTVHLLIRAGIILVFFVFSLTEDKGKSSATITYVRRFFPFLLLGFLYSETGYFNDIIFGDRLDPLFAHAEWRIFGFHPSLAFAMHFSSDLFAELMYLGYFSYYIMVFFIPLYIYLVKGQRPGEYLIFVIISSFLIYYLFFIFVPVAGPQFYFEDISRELPRGYFFGSLTGWIQVHLEVPAAAFPSSHVSICLMLIWICYKCAKNLFPIALLMGLIMIPATVYIQAHYLVDVVVAFLFTPLVYLASRKLYRYLTQTKRNHNTLT